MSQTIQEFYSAAMSCAFLQAETPGEISYVIDTCGGDVGVRYPFMIEDKRVVAYDGGRNLGANEVFFHPLKENILVGESPILGSYRKAVGIRAQYAIIHLIDEILRFGASPALHVRATVEQADLLTIVKDVDENTYKHTWRKVGDAVRKSIIEGENKQRLIHIFLKRKSVIDGRSYARLATVNFPFYEELCGEEPKVFGVRMSKKDRTTFKGIMQWIFPKIDTPASYLVGSNSNVSPFFDAILGAIEKFGGEINEAVRKMGEIMEHPEQSQYDLDFTISRDLGYSNVLDDVRGARPAPVAPPPAPVVAPAPSLPRGAVAQALAQAAPAVARPAPVAAPQHTPAPKGVVGQQTYEELKAKLAAQQQVQQPAPCAPGTLVGPDGNLYVMQQPAQPPMQPQPQPYPGTYPMQPQGGGMPVYNPPGYPQQQYQHVPVSTRPGAAMPMQQPMQPQANQYPSGLVSVNAGVPVAQPQQIPQQQQPMVGVPVAVNAYNQPIDAWGNVCLPAQPQPGQWPGQPQQYPGGMARQPTYVPQGLMRR